MKVKALSLSVVAALSLGLAANANAAEMVAAQSTGCAPVVSPLASDYQAGFPASIAVRSRR